jgi:CheY-like chemotaxis protein
MAARQKILVAEDDPFQRMSIVDILVMSNYDVTPVENGKQAIDQLKDFSIQFDMVLLDLLMPEMSGSDVLEAMMQDEYLRRIPVVVMSSRNDK